MADGTVVRSDVYVYILYREDGVTPFYVGLGIGNRWLAHERDAERNKTYKDRIILKMRRNGCLQVPKMKIAEGLTRPQAALMEIDLIAKFGRHPNGLLTNRTAGGEGFLDPSDDVREKLCIARRRRPPASAETRAKISEKNRGKLHGPCPEERKERIRASVKGFRHTDEAKAKISQASRQHGIPSAVRAKMVASRIVNGTNKHSKETIERLRVASTGRTHSPESIEKRRKKMIGFKHSPETVAKIRARRHSEETKEKIRAIVRDAWASNPQRKASQSAMAKALWTDPETRKKNVEGLKNGWRSPKRMTSRIKIGQSSDIAPNNLEQLELF